MTTRTIPNEEMGNATGLFNMLRNIGGSVGIAMATTALIRRADLHQTDLSAHLPRSSAVLQQKSAMIAGYLGHHMGPARREPRLLRHYLPPHGAASRHACLYRRLPLDRRAGLDLRLRRVAVQEAGETRHAAAGGALSRKIGIDFDYTATPSLRLSS